MSDFKEMLDASIEDILNNEDYKVVPIVQIEDEDSLRYYNPIQPIETTRLREKPISKIYEVSWDCCGCIIILEEGDDLFDILNKSDENFIKDGDRILYQFSSDYSQEINILDKTNDKGIISLACVG